jgi:hypothetical protein
MRNQANTQKAFRILSDFSDNPIIEIHQFDKISDGFYSLVFSSQNKSFTFNEYNEAVAYLTDKSFAIEAESLVPVETVKNKQLFRCILQSNVESKPYNEENVKGLTSIRANTFVDEHDVIWRLVGEEGDKRLVRVTKENFDEILEAKRSRNSIVASVESLIPYKEGDYAYFFNHETLAMDFGFIVERENNDYVFSRSKEKLVKLTTPGQVVLANEIPRDKNPALNRAKMVIAGEFSIENYLEYLRKVYGADSPYYQAMERALKEVSVNNNY